MRTLFKQAGRKFVFSGLLVTLLFCASAFSMAEDRQMTEYRVKAAFLYNFSRFVTWPKRAGLNKGFFNLCVLGEDPFGKLLDVLSGKYIQNDWLEIKRLDSLDEDHACQIVYVSQTVASDLEDIMSTLKNQPVLTVSDIGGFTSRGGIIQFKLDNNKVRFDINIDAAKRAGLTISSKLLSLATVVRGDQ